VVAGDFSIKNVMAPTADGRLILRAVAGAAVAIVAWWLWTRWLGVVPVPLRFLVAFTVFVAGPGSGVAALLRVADPIERAALTLGAGVVVAPAMAQALGEIGLLRLFPALAVGIGGAAIGAGFHRRAGESTSPRDIAACVVVALLALGAGTVAYAHRMTPTADGVGLGGDYDTFDSTYYAAISADLATEIPPDALFHAGHRLGYAYHTQLLPAMVFRFGGVPLMDLYFGYAWPAFLVVLAVVAFAAIRAMASTGVALLATVLLLLGSDLSYVAVALFRPQNAYWDGMIWSNNWLTPGAEQLYFNTWTPALVAIFLGFWLLSRYQADARMRWLAGAAVCFALLVQIKPFGFAPIVAGLAGAAVFDGGDRAARRAFTIVLGLTFVFAAPYLYGIRSVYQESQAILRPGLGYVTVLPDKVATQLHLNRALLHVAEQMGGGERLQSVLAFFVAITLFFLGGLGMRLVATPGVWRSIRRADTPAVWRLMAWTIVAGAAIPLVIITDPYHQTFHTFQASLYLLWVFTAQAVIVWGRQQRWRTAVAAAATIAIAVPSTIHYLQFKWSDVAFGFVTRDMATVGEYLGHEDPARTVFIARYPQGPSFIALYSTRRTVLAWAQYTRGTEVLQDEIDRFFQSADQSPDSAWKTLMRYHVTHVVETIGRDHINEDVRCRLQPVLETKTLRLLAVPADGVGVCRPQRETNTAARTGTS